MPAAHAAMHGISRGPTFASTSLSTGDPPLPVKEGKAPKEGGKRRGKKPGLDLATFRGLSHEQKKELLSQVSQHSLPKHAAMSSQMTGTGHSACGHQLLLITIS